MNTVGDVRRNMDDNIDLMLMHKNDIKYCFDCKNLFLGYQYPRDKLDIGDCPLCDGTLFWVTPEFPPFQWQPVNRE